MSEPVKNILVIDDKGVPGTLQFLRCFSNVPQYRIHVLSNKKGTFIPVRFSKYVASYHHHSSKTENEYITNIEKVARKVNASIILPVKESTICLFARYADRIRSFAAIPPIQDSETINMAINKWTFCQWLKKNNFPYPKTFIIGNTSDLNKELESFSFPVLLKPVHGHGGRNIKPFNNSEELIEYIAKHSEEIINKYIIQEYIEGKIIDISLLSKGGKILAYTIQKGIIFRKFSFSPGIVFFFNKEFFETAKSIIEKLKWNGIANMDFVYDSRENSYKLLDFNARYWSSILGSHSVGVNFPYLACLTALGITYSMPEYSLEPFLLTKTAIIQKLKQVIRINRIRFSLNQTQIKYIISDPLPEIIFLLSKIPFLHKSSK